MVFSFTQWKTMFPGKVSTAADSLRDVNSSQKANAYTSILRTLSSSVRVVKAIHLRKAASPIRVTVVGSCTSRSDTQFSKAAAPIYVIPSGSSTSVSCLRLKKLPSPIPTTRYLIPLYLTTGGTTTFPIYAVFSRCTASSSNWMSFKCLRDKGLEWSCPQQS